MATYRLTGGETIESVAKKYGVSVAEIRRLNPGSEGAFIGAGVELTVPSKAAAKPAAKPAPKPAAKAPASAPAAPKGVQAEKAPTGPKKRVGTPYNPLTPEDEAFNRQVDEYNKAREDAIKAQKKFGTDSAQYQRELAGAKKFYQDLVKGKAGSPEGKAAAAEEVRQQVARWDRMGAEGKISKAVTSEQRQKLWQSAEQDVAKKRLEAWVKGNEPKPAPDFLAKMPGPPAVHLYDYLSTPALKNAYYAMTTEFNKYGLGTLAPKIFRYIQEGYNSDTISLMLQETPEYKQRFAANEERIKKGMRVLSPSEYLAAEESYRQMMSQAGLPPGFYDKPSDFTNFLANDVSPKEAQDRIDLARQKAMLAPQGVKEALKEYYGIDEAGAVAYFLDPTKASEMLKQQAATAEISAASQQAGLGPTSKSIAEEAARRGVSYEQAKQAYTQIGGFLENAVRLAGIYGEQYSKEVAEREGLLGDTQAQELRKRLGVKEKATFAAQSGVGQGALGPVIENR